MAFDKAKVLKAAEKFLAQGKISSAIKEYRQIVDNDTDDLTALNMLGDLHARAGEDDDAILCFERIAEHFREQEFNLKAIAMYKKIERLKPRRAILTNLHSDLDYEVLRAKLAPHVEPGFDGLTFTAAAS